MVENCHSEVTLDSDAPGNIDCTGVDSFVTSTAMTAERAYYHCGDFFIKRGLRPSEYKTTQPRHETHPPTRKATTPKRGSNFAFYSTREQHPCSNFKCVVRTEVEQHLATLRRIKSNTIGGPSRIVLPPYRVMRLSDKNEWPRKVSKDGEYVFCHNDLAQHNIIVGPETLKIRAIIDWEYAGFFPEYFEWPFYERRGPSVALDGEHDDSADLLRFMEEIA
ncbi:hypothetical protein HFD88_006673 [Aspergillus terreus]|nr:hypothetical protein HFD88_006673 [Aspergillus terreus]